MVGAGLVGGREARGVVTVEELFQLGSALADSGEVGEAIVALERALEIDPDHARSCKLLARLSLQINERRAFVNWCHEASRIDPGDPEPYQMMAEELTRIGRHDEAAEARQAAERRLSQ
jgi:cytochrome c-type biogenesis protein CcmH/NrfG